MSEAAPRPASASPYVSRFHLLACFIFFPGMVAGQPSPSVIEAVHKGHGVGREQDGIAAVRDALEAGGDVNERDKSGWTPLMHAALECRPAIVRLLLDRRADAALHAGGERNTTFMDHGQTALSIAASCFIARRRAAIAPGRGMPPSYAQTELEAPRQIVRSFIERGANVNAADADGRTPLMMAAMHGWRGAVDELLAAKAAAGLRDLEGLSAADYADPQDVTLTRALRKAGGPPPSGRSGRTVCDAELALDKAGYDTPIIDCIWGPQLSAVVTKFQAGHALTPTGVLDSQTRNALKIR